MPHEIGKSQISDFPSQSHGGGIKKKTDNLNSEPSNRVGESKISYTPTSKTLKTTASIYNTPVGKTEIPIKQEIIHHTTPKTNANQEVSLSIEEIKKQIDIFAQGIKQHEVREILNAMPLEIKKEAITLFTNIPEHENWVNQIKNELLAYLRHYFQQDSLQILIRRPYTDSEKLYFFKQKYPQVNELINKLGLDLK